MVVEPVAGVQAAVEVLFPAGDMVRVGGSWAVAGDVGGEVAGVAPGGDLSDFVVPHLGADGVDGSGPVPPGHPVRWVTGEGPDRLVGVCGDGWGPTPKVETAWLSGTRLGQALVRRATT